MDLKGDNVIIGDANNSLHPVIIDFGKSTTLAKGKVYQLSLRDQEKYRKHHKHIAPEVVRGMDWGYYCHYYVNTSHMNLLVNWHSPV